ncbi:hypothetical protein Tco_0308182 [Tanacetum coccineum]
MSFFTTPDKSSFEEIEALFIQLTALSFVFVKSVCVPELLDVNGWNGGGSGESIEEVSVLQDQRFCSSDRVGKKQQQLETSGALIFASAMYCTNATTKDIQTERLMLVYEHKQRVRQSETYSPKTK